MPMVHGHREYDIEVLLVESENDLHAGDLVCRAELDGLRGTEKVQGFPPVSRGNTDFFEIEARLSMLEQNFHRLDFFLVNSFQPGASQTTTNCGEARRVLALIVQLYPNRATPNFRFLQPLRDFDTNLLRDEFQFLAMRNDLALEGTAKKSANGFTPALTVIQRPVVDIHANKLVGQISSHVPGILQRVLHGLGAMIKTELNARSKHIGNGFAHGWFKPFVDHVAPERQRQPVVLPAPPHAKVLANHQTLILIGQLAFVNDQAHVGATFPNRLKNLVERYHDEIKLLGRFAQPKLQG